MTDKQINLVKILDKTVFFDGDTIQFNFIEFDKPIKGVCFNKSVYIPIEELEYILQQLFDKEQECERLKNERTVDLVKQLDQLKAENEHLSEKEEEARHYLEEAAKFKNCLIEIKKIAEKTLNMVDYKTYFKRDNKSLKQESFKAIDKILQKISECEVNDEDS